MKSTRILFLTTFLFALLPGLIFGQQVSSVTGVVRDGTGAAIPGVGVRLTDTLTGLEQTTRANEIGVYLFVRQKPGQGYTLTFSAPGFKSLSLTGVALGVGTTETRDAELEIGAISETIVVEAKGEATLNTTDASIGNVIDTRRLVDLPVEIRSSPAALLGLQPGVVGNNVGTAATNRVGSVTGARADQGNITVDGIDANDQATGQAFITVANAPIDAVQEFRTVSANPDASEGRSSGAQIEIVTKSGTNQFHGSAVELHRNTVTTANSFFNNKAGIAKPKLLRNQFAASLGGPIKKDKLFFFFDYEGRRDARDQSYSRLVPLDHVREGRLAYINSNPGCTALSRLDTNPNCISILSGAQVAALDPKTGHPGVNTALLNFIKGRYPAVNDKTGGDGINTGLFRFNAPVHRADNSYISRIDWQPTAGHRVFGRLSLAKAGYPDTVNTGAASQQFPGDPETSRIEISEYGFAIGETWNINSNMVNQAVVGVSRSGLEFPTLYKPAFPNEWHIANGGSATLFDDPYADMSYSNRYVPVPTIRDDFSWIRGKHNIAFGGLVKPIRSKSALTNDFNFVYVGLGGKTATLDTSLRPADILNDANASAAKEWDTMFTTMLGRFGFVGTNFNYDVSGSALAPGTGKTRTFAYNEFEFYGKDSWKIRNDFTLTYGLRWSYYSVPYEVNGFQTTNDVDFRNLFNIRQLNAKAGVAGMESEPFLRYDLAGKANNARGYYEPDLNNFGPRLSFAYSPSFRSGYLGKLFGDRKTVFRAGGTVLYDRVGGGLTYIVDQLSYMFDNSKTTVFGATNPVTALATDPRFTDIKSIPIQNAAPKMTRPSTPFVDSGYPVGGMSGEFNYAVDDKFVTPYSITYSFGIQRELPGNFILDVSYVGRQGRKLFAQADSAQALNFKDSTSGQMLFDAFNGLQAQIQANTAAAQITAQPWFENQISAALGAPCAQVFGVSCTRVIRSYFSSLVRIGDLSDTLQALYANELLGPNVGLSSQFSTNIYNTNLGSSTYNGALVTLRKRFSDSSGFDFNYTFSHSIDNQSSVVNTVYGGLICDVTNLRTCRGNSDFDIRHLVNANWLFELPVGHGKSLLSGVPGWADQVIGGWAVNGIFTARTGLPFSTTTGSYPIGFTFNSPAVSNGDLSKLSGSIHDTSGGIQYFADPAAAQGQLRNPRGGEVGNRNTLTGPGFWSVDLAVLKRFRMPRTPETHQLQFRWELFNAFNHNSFANPAANFNASSTFGRITTSAGAARVMQFGLRYQF